jgi:hypothetical protein
MAHHLQLIWFKCTISTLKGTTLQATIYNYFASLVYNLEPKLGPNYNLKNNQTPPLSTALVKDNKTWGYHLYGNDKYQGLIPKLSQRANIIKKLCL